MDTSKHYNSRRRFAQSEATLGLLDAFGTLAPACAQTGRGVSGELRVGGDTVHALDVNRTTIGFGSEPPAVRAHESW